MKRLLAILGSPHPDGSTAAMLACAVAAAERAGWAVDRVELYREEIGLCRGCRACIETGVCAVPDGVQRIARLLQGCDAVVLAAPTYWANLPAAVKNLFDRLLGTAMEETKTFPKPRLSPRQQYLLLTACNTPAPFDYLCGQSRGAIRAMEEFFYTAGMRRMGRVVFAGAQGRGELPPSLERKICRFWQ